MKFSARGQSQVYRLNVDDLCHDCSLSDILAWLQDCPSSGQFFKMEVP